MAYPQTTFSNTVFSSPSFINRRREVVYTNTLLYQLNVLKSTGRYDAFKLKWHPSYNDKPNVWPVPNHLFWDSDVAKWIEGACYFLKWKHNVEIDAAVKELVAMIQSAQQPDGYLNIHFTVVAPGKRFTNVRDLHELYNAGHLIEAAIAHKNLYGNDLLLDPTLKYVDLLFETFGPAADQKHGYPGHPEIELALLRLFDKTRNPKHFALAKYFLEERGNPEGQDGRHYYDVEAEARGETEHEKPAYYPSTRAYSYQQAHLPITEQDTIEGHSVRAMYLLTAVADLIRIDERSDDKLNHALERLWTNMVDKKMYLTGGIGAMKQWEGFGIDYFLPSGTDEGGCYSETCAAIGVMMLAERLLQGSKAFSDNILATNQQQTNLDGSYADIMELCFYNAVMTGMSTNGKQFTYVNQLASSDTDLSKRAEWFTCACCPPNVTRLLGYIGGYLWTFKESNNSVHVNIHMLSSATLNIPIANTVVQLEEKSNWPWDGKIDFVLRNGSNIATTIKLRIPGWAADWQISPTLPNATVEKGYLTLPWDWLKLNSRFRLDIPLKPRFVSPHPYANQDTVALARGPLIYCVEDFDNAWVGDHFKTLLFDPTCSITETVVSNPDIEEPYIALTANNAASFVDPENYSGPQVSPFGAVAHRTKAGAEQLNFIPYCLRDNRGGKGNMRVTIRCKH